MCLCAEMITVLIVVGIQGDKRLFVSYGLCNATGFLGKYMFAVYVLSESEDERDEEKA